MTGLLPREISQIVHSPRALHFHDCMEGCLPIHWQQNQKEGIECLCFQGKHNPTGILSMLSLISFFPFRIFRYSVSKHNLHRWFSCSLYFTLHASEWLPNFLQINFVENKKLKSTLLEDIDESQLPDIYGGRLPLVPIQDC